MEALQLEDLADEIVRGFFGTFPFD